MLTCTTLRRMFLAFGVTAAILQTGCVAAPPRASASGGDPPVNQAPAADVAPAATCPTGARYRMEARLQGQYTGSLPCFGCRPGSITYQLNLFDQDGLLPGDFHLEMESPDLAQGGKKTVTGHWSVTADCRQVEFRYSGAREPFLFDIRDDLGLSPSFGGKLLHSAWRSARMDKDLQTLDMLRNRSWTLKELLNHDAANTGALTGIRPHLVLGDNGQIQGHTGCNTLAGDYTATDAGTLRMQPALPTQIACMGKGLAEQEIAFLLMMQNAAAWSIEILDGALVLDDARGLPLARFYASPPNRN